MKTALQLWSVRNEANDDFKKTAEQIKAMGYDGVEIAGIKNYSYAQMGEILNEVGLKALSAHIRLGAAEDIETLGELKNIGIDYVAFNGMGISQESLAVTCENITRIGRKCKEHGIYLMYHNHCYEFDMINGEPGLNLVYDGVAPEFLGAEIDTCWVQCSGLDPAEYIRKNSERCPLIHLKDYRGDHNSENFTLTVLGQGELKIDSVISAAAESGTEWIIVEQDEPEKGYTPLESAEKSLYYLLNSKKYEKYFNL